MPQYFYDYSVGISITRDGDGKSCLNDQAAVNEAWAMLPGLMADQKIILPWQHFEMIVRRDDGTHVGRVGLTVTLETQNPGVAAALAMQKNGQWNGFTS